jgi:hypothetical protein
VILVLLFACWASMLRVFPIIDHLVSTLSDLGGDSNVSVDSIDFGYYLSSLGTVVQILNQ